MLIKGVLYKKSWKNMVNNIATVFKENYHYSFNVPLNRFWTSVCYYFIFLVFLMTAILQQVGIQIKIQTRLDFSINGSIPPIDLLLIFAKSIWKIKLNELDVLSISNLNYEDYTGSKSQVQTRQKIKFIQLK